MRHRTFRGAAVLAVVVLLASTAIAYADTVPADGDAIVDGNQMTIDLGHAMTGAVVTWPVQFHLTCAGFNHAAPGAMIQLDQGALNAPDDGAIAVTSTTIGPVPATWPAAGVGCGFPAPTVAANAVSTVTLTMPTIPATDDLFTVSWTRSGASGLTSITTISFKIDVVPNTPPVLSVPDDMTVEATGPGGAAASFTATATDGEDATAPTPTCAPASGSTFKLGTTTVTCDVTDGGGLTDSGSFHVTVNDTTAPSLSLPGDLTAEATGPGGANVSFSASASDAVDGAVSVDCDHASGDTFALGVTTVSCSAIDAALNQASGSFDVTVGDTTPPSLVGMPSDMTITTGNPAGATLTYGMPGASDIADPAPTVGCLPASGSTIPVGATTVTCTATDASGHQSSASFVATVTFVSSTTWTASWGEPVATSGDTFIANSRRTIPIKVGMFANGVEQRSGRGWLSVAGCAGGTTLGLDLDWDGGRWTGHLDSGRLGGPGCYRVTAWLDGNAAGSFRLDVRGVDATAASTQGKPKAKP